MYGNLCIWSLDGHVGCLSPFIIVKSAANALTYVASSCVTTYTGQVLRSQSAYALMIWIDIAELLSTEIVSILLPAIYERACFPPHTKFSFIFANMTVK